MLFGGLDRERAEAHLLDQKFEHAVLHLEELARAVRRLAERHDARVPDDRAERIEVGEAVARLVRRDRDRLLFEPRDDLLGRRAVVGVPGGEDQVGGPVAIDLHAVHLGDPIVGGDLDPVRRGRELDGVAAVGRALGDEQVGGEIAEPREPHDALAGGVPALIGEPPAQREAAAAEAHVDRVALARAVRGENVDVRRGRVRRGDGEAVVAGRQPFEAERAVRGRANDVGPSLLIPLIPPAARAAGRSPRERPGPPPHPRGRRRGSGHWRARRPPQHDATDRSR
ncbi:hypothetical protein WME89_31200 [Sorangium sp. So ce321]|uniref:hypothetical protein n=1 Tax=Sorangium sp. So ce321 TaxID=3133300 RepID=UPI003F623EFF